jgi:hypothetical protein
MASKGLSPRETIGLTHPRGTHHHHTLGRHDDGLAVPCPRERPREGMRQTLRLTGEDDRARAKR